MLLHLFSFSVNCQSACKRTVQEVKKKVGGVKNDDKEEGKTQEDSRETDRRGPLPAGMEEWEKKVNKYK